MEKKLKDILSDVTNWLNFAEAKNLALLTFNSVWLATFVKKFFESKGIGERVLFAFFSIVSIIAIIICLISFIPKILPQIFLKTTIEEVLKDKLPEKSETDNLLFYRDIFKYSEDEYYEVIQRRKFINYENGVDNFNSDNYKYEKTMVKQIVILSGIAYKKYYLFNIAIKVTAFPFVIFMISIIIQ